MVSVSFHDRVVTARMCDDDFAPLAVRWDITAGIDNLMSLSNECGALLAVLVGKLRPSLRSVGVQTAGRLSALLDVLRPLKFGETDRRPFERQTTPDAAKLAGLLGALRDSLQATERAGLLGNPWSAASLRRNEVRNSAALAWHLNPRGGHGHGDRLLQDLLAMVAARIGTFPVSPSASCSVTVEECPDGARDSRVDIQIDDPERFFLIIEVKIDAPEQPGQLERYCQVAAARACDGRPWAVVFLTLGGGLPPTASPWVEKVVPLAWVWIAARLRRLASNYRNDKGRAVPRYLANAFADHIMTFRGGRHGRR